MRIIGGKYRGRVLFAPQGLSTRPTTDRVRENIFNLIQDYLPCGRALDLFAGTGAMGIEALSRGADFVTFIENNRKAAAVIQQNIQKVGVGDISEVLIKDAERFICEHNQKYNIIFLDPPYKTSKDPDMLSIMEGISKSGMLDGIIVMERHKDDDLSEIQGYKIIKSKIYGITSITIYVNSM